MKALAVFALGMLFAPLVHAAPPPAAALTVTCQDNGGGSETWNVYALTFDAGQSTPNYFTIYTDTSDLNQLLVDEYFGSGYSTCNFSTNTGTAPGVVTIVNTSLSASAAGVASSYSEAYAVVTFSYDFLFIGPTDTASKMKATTPEERERALAAHLARLPALIKSTQ